MNMVKPNHEVKVEHSGQSFSIRKYQGYQVPGRGQFCTLRVYPSLEVKYGCGVPVYGDVHDASYIHHASPVCLFCYRSEYSVWYFEGPFREGRNTDFGVRLLLATRV